MHLYQALSDYSRRDICPLHMPGHKRRACHSPGLPWHLDISEIDGFDNLHTPEGVLLEAEARAARLFGSEGAYFLINGSSGGILAGIYACTRPGDAILIARNCHKAVYHAVEILGLCPIYLEPPILAEAGIAGSISPQAVERALEARPDIRLAVITSPTYEGVLSDVGGIAEVLCRRGIPLFVDEAHGAHLGLSSHFSPGAIQQGADLVVQSLHKTLPSLTQTAILHRSGGLISPAALRHALGVFQSTSPSYLLLAAIDGCIAFLEAEGEAPFDAWRARLERFYEAMADLERLKLFGGAGAHIYAHDPGKLSIVCGGANLTGGALLAALREDFGIELEMALPGYALAMTGLASTDEDLERLGDALRALDRACQPASQAALPIQLPPMPAQVIPAGEALRLPGRRVGFAESVGQISRGYVWAYPPGVPLVAPGTRITQAVADCLAELIARQVVLRSTFDVGWGSMEVVES